MKQFTLLLAFLFTQFLMAQDVTVPVLTSFEISTQEVDITNGPGLITVTMGATDDISGVQNINPVLYLPNGTNSNTGGTLITGTILDGTWQATFAIPQYTQTGTANFTAISFFRDFAGNQTYITTQELLDAGYDLDFEIVDDNPSDVTPPELVSFELSAQEVDITDGPGSITVTLGATDDISGIENINPSLYLPNGSNSNKGASLISGTNLDGTYEATFTIPQYTETGTATIQSISFFKDFAGNQIYITMQELLDAGYDIDFEIVDDNPSDVTVPELVSFGLSAQIVDITDGPGSITVTLGATDDISGIENINPSLHLPNGSNSNKGASLISGTILDGTFEATFTIPQFTQTGTATFKSVSFFKDFAGNQTYITEQALLDAGYDIDFEIVDNSALPVEWYSPLKIDDSYTLTWSVSQQINNSHFEVEHSANGRIFNPIGKISSEGNSSSLVEFEYQHKAPAHGNNYYRIKQVDFDGLYSYSNTVYKENISTLSIYPNPTHTGRVTVSSSNEDKVVIYNTLGIKQQEFYIINGQTELDITSLPGGLYLLKFQSGFVEWLMVD